jgi:prephenate dehydratase
VVASTAGAAKTIAESEGERGHTDAAICSKICVGLYEGLEVLREGIQDENSRRQSPIRDVR